MFGLAAKWKRKRPDRLGRLAAAIEALGERDQKLIDESTRVDDLRLTGAGDLHKICSAFVDRVNERLSQPTVLLDPAHFSERHFNDGGPNLYQINLRGRLLQLEFEATEELYATEDFRRPYVLRGVVRSFNQDFLDRHGVDEQMIFFCPVGDSGVWYFFDGRTYRTGKVAHDYLLSELERLI